KGPLSGMGRGLFVSIKKRTVRFVKQKKTARSTVLEKREASPHRPAFLTQRNLPESRTSPQLSPSSSYPDVLRALLAGRWSGQFLLPRGRERRVE
ncbi:hypothetical protein, partial [Aneurinibacillus tyrosinisolvens]|uniref:hypothetical protein n=1 Tax=Aneurinibacillus tyrosinisolvens TaxID=1443435 RepID=UPI00063FBB48